MLQFYDLFPFLRKTNAVAAVNDANDSTIGFFSNELRSVHLLAFLSSLLTQFITCYYIFVLLLR